MKSSPMMNRWLNFSQTTKLCIREIFLPILKCTLRSPATPIWSPFTVFTENRNWGVYLWCQTKCGYCLHISMQLISAPESNKTWKIHIHQCLFLNVVPPCFYQYLLCRHYLPPLKTVFLVCSPFCSQLGDVSLMNQGSLFHLLPWAPCRGHKTSSGKVKDMHENCPFSNNIDQFWCQLHPALSSAVWLFPGSSCMHRWIYFSLNPCRNSRILCLFVYCKIHILVLGTLSYHPSFGKKPLVFLFPIPSYHNIHSYLYSYFCCKPPL